MQSVETILPMLNFVLYPASDVRHDTLSDAGQRQWTQLPDSHMITEWTTETLTLFCFTFSIVFNELHEMLTRYCETGLVLDDFAEL